MTRTRGYRVGRRRISTPCDRAKGPSGRHRWVDGECANCGESYRDVTRYNPKARKRHPRAKWVNFGRTSHVIHGYGTGHHVALEERGVRMPHHYATIACITNCGLRIEVQVPWDGVMADAAQPKGRHPCAECLAGEPRPERPLP